MFAHRHVFPCRCGDAINLDREAKRRVRSRPSTAIHQRFWYLQHRGLEGVESIMKGCVNVKGPWKEETRRPLVLQRRLVASTPTWMVDLRQGPKDVTGAPVDDIVIVQDRGRARAICDLGSGRFQFRPGGVAIRPSGTTTRVSVLNAHNIRLLGLSPQLIGPWMEGHAAPADLGRLHSSTLESPFVHQLLDRIWEAGSSNGLGTALFADAALMMLWLELLREADIAPRLPTKGGLAAWQLRRCEEFLTEHASKNVGLEELAAHVGLSPFHFARAFKRTTGVSPHRYQLGLRVELAKSLLEGTRIPITEIAFSVGYESSQALARLFRRETGLSPSEYRRQRRS